MYQLRKETRILYFNKVYILNPNSYVNYDKRIENVLNAHFAHFKDQQCVSP